MLRSGLLVILSAAALVGVSVPGAFANPPANDNFADASPVSTLPFHDQIDMTEATEEPGEPTPECQFNGDATQSAWYRFTAPATQRLELVATNITDLAAYTGTDLTSLFPQGCTRSTQLIFAVQQGVTYYLRLGTPTGSPVDVTLDAPSPSPAFVTDPPDPSSLDTIAFIDQTSDPLGDRNIAWIWDFGDGSAPSTSCCPGHRYGRDGSYTVTLSVTTRDGRTGAGSQTVTVLTHDVAVKSIKAPDSGRVGQTGTVKTMLKSLNYPEHVTVFLLRRVGQGQFVELSSQNAMVMPGANVQLDFLYNYTTVDAAARKITFRAIVQDDSGRDAVPDNNTATAGPTTVKPAP